MNRFSSALLVLLFCGVACRATQVQLGSEVLAHDQFRLLQGKRIGLLTNPSGVNRNLETTIDVLRAAPRVQLVALFGAEHGVYGDASAGDKVESRTDPRTGLPVHSLYGAVYKPTPEMLKGLDALVYDLQDTGCRAYTFISTLGLAMEACGQAGIQFIVLDRPNPLGGERIEGPLLDEHFRSFVGRWKVPYVYGLTCGELAQMINGEGWIRTNSNLVVARMKGWRRTMLWSDTGLPWVPSSPHVPHDDSPLFQIATGMLGEIGGVSTGIGYTLPFQCIAAPNLDPYEIANALNAFQLPGVRFKPITFTPYYFAFKDKSVGGAQIFFTDPRRAPLTAINYYALEMLKKVGGRDLFAEAAQANKGFNMFDKVNGTDNPRLAFQAGTPAAEIVASWRPGEAEFRKKRAKYLLY
ncbi:MAG: DUF1343 domain-containing protein [Verrucomicrobia bacterium]|nr:MAG: DUF1343 domain-containing protein [Verrucomicrobiota bacterium]